MADKKMTEEESFRESLRDLVVIIDRLRGCCSTIEELKDSCILATENELHLKLMIEFMKGKK